MSDGAVHFQETVALSDRSYSGLSTVAGAVVLTSIVGMVVVVPLSLAAFFGVVVIVSGRPIVDLVTTVGSSLPLGLVLSLGTVGLFVVGVPLLVVLMVVRRGSLGYRDEIHTRVTDSGVELDREGGYIGQSSGVTIPFETVTTVEYNDPEGDLRMNLEDVRAKKFIGGRGGDWVRIERSDAPAVYVGSNQPRILADVVADLAPYVDGAVPFS